jgi:hypothetical protein
MKRIDEDQPAQSPKTPSRSRRNGQTPFLSDLRAARVGEWFGDGGLASSGSRAVGSSVRRLSGAHDQTTPIPKTKEAIHAKDKDANAYIRSPRSRFGPSCTTSLPPEDCCSCQSLSGRVTLWKWRFRQARAWFTVWPSFWWQNTNQPQAVCSPFGSLPWTMKTNQSLSLFMHILFMHICLRHLVELHDLCSRLENASRSRSFFSGEFGGRHFGDPQESYYVVW